MANIKQTFIEAIRATPDGISTFLETPIPEAPEISTPEDTDTAIIANGVCAKYVLDLFRPFAGLTPIEMILRVGQHSNVAEVLALAGLEYIGESNAQSDLKILAPTSGAKLLPGNTRLQAQASNGTMTQCAVEIGTDTISLDDSDGLFEGYITLEEGSYTATFSGLFEGNTDPITADVAFVVTANEADEPQPPGGTDTTALQKATDDFKGTIDDLLYAIAGNSPIGFILDKLDLVKAAFNTLKSLASLAGTAASSVMDQAATALNNAGDAIASEIEGSLQAAENFVGDAAAKVSNACRQLWDKLT